MSNPEDQLASQLPSAHSTFVNESMPDGPGTFISLPAEVLMGIGQHLPLASAASLEQCCQHTRNKLDKHFSRELRIPTLDHLRARLGPPRKGAKRRVLLTPAEKETEVFMLLLERDSVDKVYCHFCLRLHAPGKTEMGYVLPHSGLTGQAVTSGPERLPCTVANHCSLRYHENFTYANCRMLMKTSLRGLSTAAQLDILNHTEVRNIFTIPTPSGCLITPIQRVLPEVVRSVQVRVKDGNLLLREQNWILTPSRDPERLPPHFICPRVPCEHINISRLQSDGRDVTTFVGKVMECGLRIHGTNKKCHTCFDLQRCFACGIEYQVNTLNLGFGFATVVTAWKNLGQCENPWDPKWARHFNNDLFVSGDYATQYWLHGEPIWIKHAFESEIVDVEFNLQESDGIIQALAQVYEDRDWEPEEVEYEEFEDATSDEGSESEEGEPDEMEGIEGCDANVDEQEDESETEVEEPYHFEGFGDFDKDLVEKEVDDFLGGTVVKVYA